MAKGSDVERTFRNTLGRSDAAAPRSSNLAESYRQMGLARWDRGRREEAILCFHQATRCAPDSLAAHSNYAEALAAADRFDQALPEFRRVLELRADHLPTHLRLGRLIERHGWVEESAACYENALRIDPGSAEGHRELGRALIKLLRPDEALASFDRSLEYQPDSADARLGRAIALLAMGRFESGWDEYEWRFAAKPGTTRPTSLRRWDRSTPSDRTVLTIPEQGLGTEVLFASCLPDLIAEAPHCLIECDTRLVNLLARSFPAASVYAKKEQADGSQPIGEREADCQIPLGSLPGVFRRSMGDFPNRGAYLAPDERLAAKWRARLARLGAGLKIGLSWRAGLGLENVLARSIPLDRWLPLFSVPNTHWVNVQYGPSETLLGQMRRRHNVTIHAWDDLDALTDIDDLAALACSLDLIISVSNSTVHLAAAMGTPVWAMLPRSSDWRWLLDRDDSPWHASVRLFRQSTPGEWTDVVDRIHRQLLALRATAVRQGA